MEYAKAHVDDWQWHNRGGEIVLDLRLAHVGYYLAVDTEGGLWVNKYYGDGRGMIEYNYGSGKYSGSIPVPEILDDIRLLDSNKLVNAQKYQKKW